LTALADEARLSRPTEAPTPCPVGNPAARLAAESEVYKRKSAGTPIAVQKGET
jgi:hypothetical protein